MKHLLILLLPIFLWSNWSFTKDDLFNLSDEQLEVLRISYDTGQQFGDDLGLTLAAISIVENRAKRVDNNPNHICGPHQINIYLNDVSCTAVESNTYLSSLIALRNLRNWAYVKDSSGRIIATRPLEKRIRMYNVGYTDHKHQWVYLTRVQDTQRLLMYYFKLWY